MKMTDMERLTEECDQKPTERQELKNKIDHFIKYWAKDGNDGYDSYSIADFILAGRQAILDKVCEPLKKHMYNNDNFEDREDWISSMSVSIDKSLNLAEEMTKG